MTRRLEMQYEIPPDADCRSCRWWKWMIPKSDDVGECRRHAPTPRNDGDHDAWWPTTGASDFCGEWHPDNREPPVPPESDEN